MSQTEMPEELYLIRHSLAHVLAQAVQNLYPKVELGFGPPTEYGFYYDFDFKGESFSEEKLKELETQMRKIINQKQEFKRIDGDYEAIFTLLEQHRAEPYKKEHIKNLYERGERKFSAYINGPFIDLCEGPHVENSQAIPADGFKLDRVAGAYWLGDENNPMLTRIYGLAFKSKAELKAFLDLRTRVESLDHKKLGRELEIFHIDERVGKGLPLWLPNGTVICDAIERYAEELEFKYDYQRVSTPHITKAGLYECSGHLPSYEDSMFPPMIERLGGERTERYYLKPMNCPHHHLIFDSRPRSYKELPLRLAEYGTTYRYEQTGELSGLLRVRAMTLNDAHIYLREEQIGQEISAILAMYKEAYETFGLKNYRLRLSLRAEEKNEKYAGEAAMWDRATQKLREALDQSGFSYFEGKGEAAFYGPKIDFQFRNLMGREETLSTIQVDFLVPERFGLKYIDEQGKNQQVVCIHRSPLSTLERFVSLLIEYYGGAFPLWCAPVQVCLIPVNDDCLSYCEELRRELKGHMVRSEIDQTDHSFNKKIRVNTMRKIPVLLIVGKKEVEESTVTVRRYGITEQEELKRADFVQGLLAEIKSRRMRLEPQKGLL